MISNTENYAVIILYPVSMDLGQMYKENMHPMRGMTPVEGPTRIYIMDLRLKYFQLYHKGAVCVISNGNLYVKRGTTDSRWYPGNPNVRPSPVPKTCLTAGSLHSRGC